MYVLDVGKLLEWDALKQRQFTAPTFSLVFALLSREVVQPLPIARPTAERSRVIELDNKANAVRSSATSDKVGLSLEDHQQLLYRAGAQRLGSVHTSSVKNRKQSSSVMTIAHQRKMFTRTTFEEGGQGALESVAKQEYIRGVTTAESGPLEAEAESAFQVLVVAIEKYCFIQNTSCNELRDPHEL